MKHQHSSWYFSRSILTCITNVYAHLINSGVVNALFFFLVIKARANSDSQMFVKVYPQHLTLVFSNQAPRKKWSHFTKATSHFNVFFDQLLDRRTATWSLFPFLVIQLAINCDFFLQAAKEITAVKAVKCVLMLQAQVLYSSSSRLSFENQPKAQYCLITSEIG